MTLDPRGWMAACAAFVLWGVLPIYWKLLGHLSPFDVVAHRGVWSVLILLPLVGWRRRWRPVAKSGRPIRWGRAIALHSLAAVLLAANWLTYVWATLNERIVEASLGYFLLPLVNVLLGAVLLGERLRRGQAWAVILAAIGVALQMVAVGRLPWVALVLACSFACYGLIGKKSQLDSLGGLTLEASLAVPVAIGWLALQHGGQWWAGMDTRTVGLVLALGLVTTAPLMLFGIGARRLPLSVLGLLQFIAPTLQFMCGWIIYNEPLSTLRLASFAVIWAALLWFLWHSRRRAATARAAPSG